MSLSRWSEPHFKQDEPSRIDVARHREREAATAQRRIHAEIDARDRRQCRACGRHSDPDRLGLTTRAHRHHLVYRSAGGSDEAFNRVTLCAGCHADEHTNRLRIDGNPDVALTFWRRDADRVWFVVREELAVRVIRRD